MPQNLISNYYRVLDDMKRAGISKIRCDELFKRYSPYFCNNYKIFESGLEYLETQGELNIERINTGDIFLYSVEVIY